MIILSFALYLHNFPALFSEPQECVECESFSKGENICDENLKGVICLLHDEIYTAWNRSVECVKLMWTNKAVNIIPKALTLKEKHLWFWDLLSKCICQIHSKAFNSYYQQNYTDYSAVW